MTHQVVREVIKVSMLLYIFVMIMNMYSWLQTI